MSPARLRTGPVRLHLLREIHEAVESFGVAQGLLARGLLRRGSGEDLLHRNLQLLAVQGLRYIRDREDLVRHMPWGGVFFDARLDPTLEVVVEVYAFLQDHEERHEGVSALAEHVHHEALRHLIDPIYSGVDLACPHPDTTPVYGRVGATVDYAGAIAFDLDPIPVAPHTMVDIEVALPVALPF